MGKTKLIMVISTAAIFLTGISAVSAFDGFRQGMMEKFKKNLSQEEKTAWQNWREAKLKALENNDYKTWKELMAGKGRAANLITEQNFSKFAEMHKLMKEGKYEEAGKIREELGLGKKFYGRKGMMKGMRNCPMLNSSVTGTSVN